MERKKAFDFWMSWKNFPVRAHMHVEPFSLSLAFSLITAEPWLILAYGRGNQAGTTESNIWTSQCWCVQSRACVCRGGFEISSTPSLLTRRRGCVCLAPVGQWHVRKLLKIPAARFPPVRQPFTHTHTHAHSSLSPSPPLAFHSTDLHCVR